MTAIAEKRRTKRLRSAAPPDFWLENGVGYARTIGLAAAMLKVSERTVKAWLGQGCPGEPGRYCPGEMVAWRDSRRPDPVDGDPLLADGADSPALEEYRRAKAALARLDLAEREKQLVRVEEITGPLMEAAAVVRAAGETIGRQYGPEAQEIVNEAVTEYVAVVKRLGGEDAGSA